MMNCIICGAKDVRQVTRTRDRHYGVKGEFLVVACQNCGLLRLDPMPTEEDLFALYATDYYAYHEPKLPGLWRRLGRRLFRTRIPTHDPRFAAPGDFLDIGCGAGEHVLLMRHRGWRACGVEPILAGAEAGWNAGIDIRHASLQGANFPDSSFDYVRLNHSFEHTVNPLEILTEIRRILRPGGKLFLGVPNSASLSYKIFKRYWWYLGVPFHPFTYSPSTLSQLLKKAGFTVESIHFNSNYFSVIGSLQIFLNRHNGKTSEEGWLTRSLLMKLLGNIIARTFDLIHLGDAMEVICGRAECIQITSCANPSRVRSSGRPVARVRDTTAS